MVIRNHLLYKSKPQGGEVSFIKINRVLTWVIKGMRIDTLLYHHYSLYFKNIWVSKISPNFKEGYCNLIYLSINV